MTPSTYLASIAGARALYLWLYEDAKAMLPPPVDGEQPRPVESRSSQADIAKALGWGRGTVSKELVRLVNFGWIDGRRIPRRLGMRRGNEMHLLADLAAEEATGERGVVSRLVVRVERATDPARREPIRTDGRGPSRKWDPDDVGGEW